MKKLIYSTLGIALIASALITGCKETPPVTPPPAAKGPKITFQTNTGTTGGYTFANETKPVSTPMNIVKLKFGVVVTSDENLKSTKLTVKFNNQAETIIGTDSIFTANTKTCNRDYYWEIPEDKGVYTITAYATDKNATTTTSSIKITAVGPIAPRTPFEGDTIFSLKAPIGKFSAYNLLQGEAITASGTANISERDIVDMSTSNALSRSWTSQNGTQFIMNGTTGKLNSKTYTQFKYEQDIIDAWNATPTKSSSITGIELGNLIIARSTQGGSTHYYLIAVDNVNDDTNADNDYIVFQYSE